MRECLEARLAAAGVLRLLFELMSASASKQVRRHEHGLEQCCMPHFSSPCWEAAPPPFPPLSYVWRRAGGVLVAHDKASLTRKTC